MGIESWFNGNIFGSGKKSPLSHSSVYTYPITAKQYADWFLVALYSRILTDTFERTKGEFPRQVLSRGVVQEVLSNDGKSTHGAGKGLIALVAEAMAQEKQIGLVYVSAVDIVRVAEQSEEKQAIPGQRYVKLSFEGMGREKIMRLLAEMDYHGLAGALKDLFVSTSLALKVSGLRSNVAAMDSDKAAEQAEEVMDAIRRGREVLLDKEDILDKLRPDLAAANAVNELVNKRLSTVTSMPKSYIEGIQTGGIGSSGENDVQAVERGLRGYFDSIVAPVCKALFGEDVSFVTQNYRSYTPLFEALKTFELTDMNSSEYLTEDQKKEIIEKLLGD